MKIAVLGGGIAGLTAAYDLSQKGYDVELFERSETLGGLARGFKPEHWDWPLEFAYHHIFANDTDIITFAEEIGFHGIYFKTPETNSVYEDPTVENNYRIIPVDSPKSFLQFPLLPLFDRVRASFFLAILKFLPMLPLYERMSSEEFVRTFMGDKMWSVFFQELFRKKFGKYAGNILASFLWARINKRTQSLGYMKKGFQSFVDALEQANLDAGVKIHKGTLIKSVKKTREGFAVNGKKFAKIVSTLPSPALAHVADNLLPASYKKKLTGLSYLDARVLILETDKPVLNSSYWLNICTPKIPAMVVAQHTNFVDKEHYGGNHITYVGWYDERDSSIMKKPKDQLIKMLDPHLRAVEGSKFKIKESYSFIGPFAQPIFDRKFKNRKPDFHSPVKGLYVANLDMTYPYDRGTNYAVKLGREVATLLDVETLSGINR